MVIGITMVKIQPGQERSVYWSIRGLNGIMDLYHVFGEFDLFVVMQAEGIDELNERVDDIKKVPHVIMSRTLLVGLDNGLQGKAIELPA